MGSPYFKFLPPEQQPQAQPPAGDGIVWDDEKPTQPGGSAGIVWDDDKPKEKERGLNLDLVGETVGNLYPSLVKNVGETVEGVKTMVGDPLGTVGNLGKLGLSVMGDVPLTKAPVQIMKSLAEKLPEGNPVREYFATLDEGKQALIKDYMETYGGGQKFLKTLATDPFRLLTDIATIASGGELAAATLPGKLGAVTTKIARKAQLGDPINAVTGLTTATGKGALRLLDATTGVGQGVMQDALKFGFQGGEAGDLFRKGLREIDPAEVANIAREGLDTWKQRVSADFQADKAIWDKSNAQLDFTPMQQAQQRVTNSMYSQTGNKTKLVIKPSDQDKINKAFEIIEVWRNDPTAHTVLGMDDLKKAIRNQIDWKNDSSVVTSALTDLSNTAKSVALKAADPKYRTSLKNYSDAMEQMEEVEKALGLGDKTALHTTLTKLQKTVRNNANTQYGLQKDLATRLETEGGKSFMPMLSGQALSSWVPRGIARGVAAGNLPGLGGLGALFFDPLMGAGVAAGAAATSPRLVGSSVHNIGRLAGTSRYIPETVRGTFGKFMSQPMRNAYANYGRMAGEEENPQPRFRGGRASYAYGGRPRRYAQGGVPEEGALTALKGPYSEIGLGSIAQAAKRRIGAVAPPRTPPVAIPEAPKLQFSKEMAPNFVNDAVKQVQTALAPDEDKEKNDQAKRLADALAAAQAAQAKTTTGGAASTSGGTYKPTGDADLDKYLAANAGFESGHDTQAVNKGSGARGMYQFLPSTWASLIKAKPELGLTMENLYETNPEKAKAYQTKAMQAFTADNAAHFEKTFGRKPTGGELYAMHLLGAGGGSRLVSGADQDLTRIVDAAAYSSNPFMHKYKTGRDLLDWMNKRFS